MGARFDSSRAISKAIIDALGLSHDSLSDVSTSDHHTKTGASGNKICLQSITLRATELSTSTDDWSAIAVTTFRLYDVSPGSWESAFDNASIEWILWGVIKIVPVGAPGCELRLRNIADGTTLATLAVTGQDFYIYKHDTFTAPGNYKSLQIQLRTGNVARTAYVLSCGIAQRASLT